MKLQSWMKMCCLRIHMQAGWTLITIQLISTLIRRRDKSRLIVLHQSSGALLIHTVWIREASTMLVKIEFTSFSRISILKSGNFQCLPSILEPPSSEPNTTYLKNSQETNGESSSLGPHPSCILWENSRKSKSKIPWTQISRESAHIGLVHITCVEYQTCWLATPSKTIPNIKIGHGCQNVSSTNILQRKATSVL